LIQSIQNNLPKELSSTSTKKIQVIDLPSGRQ
jgi:hypothetical protein